MFAIIQRGNPTMNPLRSTSKEKRSEIPISLKLYRVLENHASEVSKKLGYEVTVDEFAEACLIYGLDDKPTLEKAIKEAKMTEIRTGTKTFEVSFNRNSDIDFFTIKSGKLSYRQKIRLISHHNAKKAMAKALNLNASEVDNLHNGLMWQIVDAYTKWHKKGLEK